MTHYEQELDRTVTKRESKEASSSSTTTTTVVHAPGRIQEYILDAYEQNIGPWDLKAQQIITRAANYGIEPQVIMAAIEDTGWAPRPSKQYLAAILRRYMAEGVRTTEDLLRDQDRFEQFRQSDLRRRHAKWYDDKSVLTEFDWRRDMPF